MNARLACVVVLASLSACRSGADSAAADAAGEHPAAFVGRWESTTTGDRGLGAVIDLAADGSMTGGVAVLVDAKWTLRGALLQFRSAEGAASETEVSFAGDTMTVVQAAPTGPHRRVGAATPGASPLVGTWTYPHPVGGNAFERYLPDGRMEFRLVMPGAARGTWSAAGDQLTIDWKGSRRTYAAKRDGDVLTLTDGESHANPYRRTDAWYVFPAVFRD